MHRFARALAVAALAAAGLAPAVPAHAVTVFGCSATQDGFGWTSCTYIAGSNSGYLKLDVQDGTGGATVECSSGGSAGRTSSGTTIFGQRIGDTCTVTVDGWTSDALIRGEGGSNT